MPILCYYFWFSNLSFATRLLWVFSFLKAYRGSHKTLFTQFSFSYSPTEVGEWGWVVYYDGEEKPWINYDGAYGEWNPISVNSPTSGPSDGDGNGNGTEPPPAALPMEYVYAAIAVIVIVIVAFLAYFFLKKK